MKIEREGTLMDIGASRVNYSWHIIGDSTKNICVYSKIDLFISLYAIKLRLTEKCTVITI